MRRIRQMVAGAAALAVLSGLALSGTALAQSASSSGSASGSAKTSFIYGDTSPIDSLNPMVGYNAVDFNAWATTYDLPINYATTDLSPDYAHSMVTSVSVSPDNMSFTYTMRPNMKFSDGTPFTANDVAWTMNYYKKHNIANYSSDLALMKDTVATDDTHFVLHSTKPTALYSGKTVWLYEFILPEHVWSKYKDATKAPGWPAVGSGPYVISNFASDSGQVTLDRNPYYWGNDVPGMRPHYDRIIYEQFKDPNQEAAALQNGEIDYATIGSANILNALHGKPNITTHGANTPFFEELGFNTGSAFQTNPAGGFVKHGDGIHAAADPAFRRAIREAVDDQVIVDKVLLGYGSVGVSPVPPSATTGDWQPSASENLPFNLDKAKADLAAAGYKDTDGNGIVNDPVTHKDVILRYAVRTSDQNSINTAPYVSSWLKQIGVGTKVQAMTDTALTSAIEAGNYDMFDWDWYPGPDPAGILNVLICSQRDPNPQTYRNSDSYYCNPEFDKLYDQQLVETDSAKRADIIHQMQAMLYHDEPYVILYNAQTLQAYRNDRVTGFLSQPEKDGDLLATYGPLSFISIRPVTGSATEGSSSISGTVWIIGAVLVVIVIGGIVMLSRRRQNDEDTA